MSSVRSIRFSGGVAVAELEGRITAGLAAESVRGGLVETFQKGHKLILVNMADVAYLDSTALGELVAAYSTITRDGGAIKLACCNNWVLQLLKLTRLDSLFEVWDDERGAIASFGSKSHAAQQRRLDEFLD
jgi:anti-sigma B factor antagonist